MRYAIEETTNRNFKLTMADSKLRERLAQLVMIGSGLQLQFWQMIRAKNPQARARKRRSLLNVVEKLELIARQPCEPFERNYILATLAQLFAEVKAHTADSELNARILEVGNSFETIRHLPFLDPT